MTNQLARVALQLWGTARGMTNLTATPATHSDLIPLELLLGDPVYAAPKLSPDGKQIAYLAPVNELMQIFVSSVDGSEARQLTSYTDRGVYAALWMPNAQTLVAVRDTNGDENLQLISINSATGETRPLIALAGVAAQPILASHNHPDLLAFAMNRDDPTQMLPYTVDVHTGEITQLAEDATATLSWVLNPNLQVVGRMVMTPEGATAFQRADAHGQAGANEFTQVHVWEAEDALTSGVLVATADGSLLVNDSSKGNTSMVTRWPQGSWEAGSTCSDPAGEAQVVLSDEEYDASWAGVLHQDTWEPLIGLVTTERSELRVLDDQVAPDVVRLTQHVNGDIEEIDVSRDLSRWLVTVGVSDGPSEYLLYERATGELTHIAYTRPALRDLALAPMKPITYTARDGRVIHGYLTLPVGTSGPVPLVLNVHGGPWHRDTWGFRAEAQWMANRGWGCLQVNFRGSTGYGKEHVDAGDRQWGGAMHDDLVDAARWVVDEGFAAPGKVAIYGGSYGGYSAFVGATMTPQEFCCAVAIVGITSLVTFQENIPAYWQPIAPLLHRRVGHPVKDRDLLLSRSPISHADNVSIPLLIGHGKNDVRCTIAEAEVLVHALEKKGIDHEFVVYDDEGHGFANSANRLDFYGHAERFLKQHLN